MSFLLDMPRSFIHSRCRLRHLHLLLFLPFRHSAHEHRCDGQIDLGPEEQEHAVAGLASSFAMTSAMLAGLTSPSAMLADPEGMAGLASSFAMSARLEGEKLSCSFTLTKSGDSCSPCRPKLKRAPDSMHIQTHHTNEQPTIHYLQTTVLMAFRAWLRNVMKSAPTGRLISAMKLRPKRWSSSLELNSSWLFLTPIK